MLEERLCAKPGCGREAVASLVYDYDTATVVIGPLGEGRPVHGYELCAFHEHGFVVPHGWELIRPVKPSQASRG